MKILKYVALVFLFLCTLIGGFKYFALYSSNETELNLSIDNQIKSFDPAVVFNDDGLTVINQSLETLFQYHYLKRPYEVIPLLAEAKPVILNEGRTYLIKIKKDIFYHNHNNLLPKDRSVKADDFVWAIKRLAFKPLRSTGTWLFEGKIKGFDRFSKRVGDDISRFYSEELEGVSAVDDQTLKIELIKPEPNLLYFLAMNFTSPTPLELLKKYNNDLSEVLIGTGPFYLSEQNDNEYSFSRFKRFHEEFYPAVGDRYANTQKLLNSSRERLPFLNKVKFKIIPNDESRWEAFKQNKLDILNLPKRFIPFLAQDESMLGNEFEGITAEVKHFSRQTSRWLGFNMKDPVIGKNKKLRQAIAHSIDFNEYLKVVTSNTSLKANSIFNPSIPGYRPSMKLSYDFNRKKAHTYLLESGVNPSTLDLTYYTRGKEEIHFKEANFIRDQLKELGIDLKIIALSFPEFLKKGRAGKLQFWTDNWIYDYPDGENILQLLVSKNHPGINKSAYSNKQVDRLFKKMSVTLNKKKRFKLMYDIEKIVLDEIPWVMLMYESTYIIQRKSVQNFRKSFFIRNYTKYLRKN